MEAFRNSTPGLKGRALPGPDDDEQIPALPERGRARVNRFFAHLDRRLAATPLCCRRQLYDRRHHRVYNRGIRRAGEVASADQLPASGALGYTAIGAR